MSSAVSRAVSENGRLDVYFANAGISHIKTQAKEGGPPQLVVDMLSGTRTAQDISAAEFSEVVRVNALSVFLALKYAVPAMERTSASKPHAAGSIVSTASVAGVNANGGPLPYSATKAAVINMTKNAAYEVAGKNIRINCICPGLIKTDMTKTIFDIAALAGLEEGVGQLNPLGRHGLPEGERMSETQAADSAQRSARLCSGSRPTSPATSTDTRSLSTAASPPPCPTSPAGRSSSRASPTSESVVVASDAYEDDYITLD